MKDYFLFLLVFIPRGKYSGQKLIKLVSKNTTARTNKIIPAVPVTFSVKNKKAIRAAIKILTILSMVPMFFFITVFFND